MEEETVVVEYRDHKPDKAEEIERWFEDNYVLRYNVVKAKIEFRPHDGSEGWQFITDYWVNSCLRKLRTVWITYPGKEKGTTSKINLATTAAKVREILQSDFTPKVDPLQDYFKRLPTVDAGSGYIDRLCATVQVRSDIPDHLPDRERNEWRETSPEKLWPEYMKRWMVGAVANLFDYTRCLNQVCPVLTGEQGAFKTTWINNLCPKELHQYLFSSQINPMLKETIRLLSEMFIINIDDQLDKLNRKDSDFVKNFITMPTVQTQRPYAHYIEEEPHRASCIGSVNGRAILSDTTGNRRFLPFEVVTIDLDRALAMDINKVWAEALSLYWAKYRYWFTAEERAILEKHNEQFRNVTVEEDMVDRHLELPTEANKHNHTQMLSTELLGYLQKSADEMGLRLQLSVLQLNKVLQGRGFRKVQKTHNGKPRQWVYPVVFTNMLVKS